VFSDWIRTERKYGQPFMALQVLPASSTQPPPSTQLQYHYTPNCEFKFNINNKIRMLIQLDSSNDRMIEVNTALHERSCNYTLDNKVNLDK
jgi:hypothetical protein